MEQKKIVWDHLEWDHGWILDFDSDSRKYSLFQTWDSKTTVLFAIIFAISMSYSSISLDDGVTVSEFHFTGVTEFSGRWSQGDPVFDSLRWDYATRCPRETEL